MKMSGSGPCGLSRRCVTCCRQALFVTRPARRFRFNRRVKPFSVPAEVQAPNALSQKFTVIEVTGLDRTGLLHDLTREIADLSLTIGSAHIGTYGEKAVDVFYVTDLTGSKIELKARQKRIHDRLMKVLEPQNAVPDAAKRAG